MDCGLVFPCRTDLEVVRSTLSPPRNIPQTFVRIDPPPYGMGGNRVTTERLAGPTDELLGSLPQRAGLLVVMLE